MASCTTLSAQVAQSQASHPAPQTPAGPPGWNPDQFLRECRGDTPNQNPRKYTDLVPIQICEDLHRRIGRPRVYRAGLALFYHRRPDRPQPARDSPVFRKNPEEQTPEKIPGTS